MTEYRIAELKPEESGGISFRGNSVLLWRSHDPEVVLSGPAETGKTFVCLHKLDALMWKYPGAQSVIVRKTLKSTVSSVVQTYVNKVLGGWKKTENGGIALDPKKTPVTVFGGQHPEWFDYPNGSRVWVGGMDNPDKVLSSERDVIYVNQAEELALSDWEYLLTRATGRAGNIPYAHVMGDCNPGGSKHWIRERAKEKKLVMLNSRHVDNPTLYDDNGNQTEQGKRSMAVLSSLTGVRYKRLYLGEWVTAEGAVYDGFNRDTHVVERPPADFQRYAMAMDEGYTNPAVILLIGIDGDGRLHVAREYYERGKLQKDVVDMAARWATTYPVETVAVDAAAAGLIADLRDVGLPAVPRKGRVLDGITQVQSYLKIQGDGRPRLTVDPGCVNVINEFESYVWRDGKDEPVKDNDHACDSLRYYISGLSESVGYGSNPLGDYRG